MNSLVKKVQNFAFHNKLFLRGERILIGISGGPDSICLSRVLLQLKDKHKLTLALLHVNYCLRAEDSQQDEQFVREFAKKNDLPLKVVKYPKGEQLKPGNLEAKLRDFRYRQLERFAQQKGFNKIALAHNTDDQLETFLMNLFRGAGTQGLSAMRPQRGEIIRPLLGIAKTEILQFLSELKQEYRIDQSNADRSFLRNRIRHELVPILEQYSPQLRTRILQLTDNLQAEREIVEEIVEKKYNNIVQQKKAGQLVLLSDLQNCSAGVQKALFRLILRKLKGDFKDISHNHFFEFNKIVTSKKAKKQWCIVGGVLIERQGEKVMFSKK